MRILVTGASGFVGSSLCSTFTRAGHSVIGAVREAPRIPAEHFQPLVVGDFSNYTRWDHALDGVDAVVHLAARAHVLHENAIDPLAEFCRVNVTGTERLAKAAVNVGVRRLVYVSSIGVMGNQTTTDAFTEVMQPNPQDLYAISKLKAEEMLKLTVSETDVKLVIVRPPLVYGPGNPGNFLRLIQLVDSGIPLPLASIRNQRSFLFLGNLVDALIRCTTHANAAGQIFLLSDGAPVSTSELITILGQALRRPAKLFPIPPSFLKSVARVFNRSGEVDRLLNSLVVNDSKIRNRLDWKPPFSMEEGLNQTASWYRSRKIN